MSSAPLAGVGVLVTRPAAQQASFARAIEAVGGAAIQFPAIEISPKPQSEVAAFEMTLGAPDISVFVSQNAVEYGLLYAGDGDVAAVGPTTAAAIRDAGRTVNICPESGFDSEHLLQEAALQDVSGKVIRIIRGVGGRGLLGDELRVRGAEVDYLEAYERRLPEYDADTLDELERRWKGGEVGVVTVMSVNSLDNLDTLLPDWCRQQLAVTPLVTPAARVIKEALNRYPEARTTLAAGPQTPEMIEAIALAIATSRGQA